MKPTSNVDCASLITAIAKGEHLKGLENLADWLTENGDPRGLILRNQIAVTTFYKQHFLLDGNAKPLQPISVDPELLKSWFPFADLNSDLRNWFPYEIFSSRAYFQKNFRLLFERFPNLRFVHFVDRKSNPWISKSLIDRSLVELDDLIASRPKHLTSPKKEGECLDVRIDSAPAGLEGLPIILVVSHHFTPEESHRKREGRTLNFGLTVEDHHKPLSGVAVGTYDDLGNLKQIYFTNRDGDIPLEKEDLYSSIKILGY